MHQLRCPHRVVLLALAVCLAVPVLTAVAAPTRAESASAAPTSATRFAAARARSADRGATQRVWTQSFARLERDLSGSAGVAVIGVRHDRGLRAGSWRTGVAWSTAKVPLSVAALRRSSSGTTRSLVRRTITVSDNAAAERLWTRLGRPSTAGARVQRVVRDLGDRRTIIEHRRVRPPFTAFGQTRWALTDQARFASGLACRREARPVLTRMGQIVRSQRFGLGQVPRTGLARSPRFKGGWGPIGRGYLVRQLGIVTLADGTTYGVAIAAYSPRGYAAATRDLDRVARWLLRRIHQVPAERC